MLTMILSTYTYKSSYWKKKKNELSSVFFLI